MWCLRCSKLYAEGVKTCTICGGDLIEYKPILSEEETTVLDVEKEKTFDWVENLPEEDLAPQPVVTVEDPSEAKRYIALLDSHKIPALMRETTDEVAALFAEEEEEETNPAVCYEVCVPETMFRKALAIVMEEDEAADSVPVHEEAREEDDSSFGGWLRRNFSKKK